MTAPIVPTIPDAEFADRMRRFQANIAAAGLDACLVHSNEADAANVRYLTEYWPTFESAGVFVPAQGTPVLLIGPESEWYAAGRSKLPDIMKMVEYRESADPEYPGIEVANYQAVKARAMGGAPLKKLGLVGCTIMPLPVIDGLKRDLPDVELVRADQTLVSLRAIKSKAEIACMRRAFEISELAVQAILDEMQPGMTELQVTGIAQREIYKHGGEYEGHALYVFCGQATNNAISRPTQKVIVPNEVIQLNIGARVSGYSSSVGIPVSFGKLEARKEDLIKFGLEGHFKTQELICAGRPAGQVVTDYEAWVESRGYKKYMLYGPCHGIGMMEVERPWMESTSKYELADGMTFQVDTFFYDHDFGLRWENGIRVTPSGIDNLSKKFMKVVTL